MSESPSNSRRSWAIRAGLFFAIVALVVAATLPASSYAEEGSATWYGQPFHGRRMANGQVFDMNDPTTTASNQYPFGTWLKVTNPANGRTVVVQVRDRGGFGHALDLSYAAFAALDDPAKMKILVHYEVVTGPGAIVPAPNPTPSTPPPPAPAPPATKPAVQQGPPPDRYTVAPGDTLFGIARRYDLDASSLSQWNNMENPDRLVAGQNIALRPPASHSSTPSSRGGPASAVQAKVYVVVEGDTLWDIAASYGTTPERLVELNGLSDDDTIIIGQSLRIGNGSTEAASSGISSDASGRYVVQEGDTVFAIALKHGTTSAEIVRMNGLSDADLIMVGAMLAVP